MKQIDSDIGDMSINDKVIRIRNLKLNLQKIKTRSFDVEHINKDERLLRLINSTCEDFRELSTANKIFLLNALSFYEIRNERFWEQVCTDVLNHDLELRNSIDCVAVLSFLAKSRYTNIDVLRKIEEILAYRNERVHLAHHIDEMWAFTVLGYYKHSKEYIKKFNNKILNLGRITMKIEEIAKSLLSYSLINEDLNIEVLKTLISKWINNKELQSSVEGDENQVANSSNLYHSITVIVQSLARLNVRNTTLFSIIADKILTDAQREAKIPINAKEAAQIFASFSKMEFFNMKLMRVLEDLFIMNIKISVPETTANMLLSHIDWAKFIVKETFEEDGSKQLFKTFKKYHISFVNLLLKDILDKGVENINYHTWFFITKMCNLKHLKNRDNARLINEIGVKGIANLKKHLETLESKNEKDAEILQYYSHLSQTILNKASEKNVKEEFEKADIDIEEILDRVESMIASNKNTSTKDYL